MKKKFIYTSLIGLLLAGSIGCKKIEDFGIANDNPAATTTPRVDALLTNSIQNLRGYTFFVTGGYYAQYFSQSQYPDAMLYALNQDGFTGNYSGILYDLENIQLVNSSNNQNQVAKILQQYVYFQLTNRWGDLPYSQALKGITVNAPAYDTQEAIYKGMLAALTTAATSFDGSAITGDVIYNGDVASWKRVANSLRLVMSIQLSKKYPGASDYAATQFKAALADAGGVIITNAQNMTIIPAAPNFRNVIWDGYNGRKDYGESKTMTDLTGSLADARQAVFGGASEQQGNTATSSVGIPYGGDKGTTEGFTNNNPTWARVLRGDKRDQSSPMYVITASQIALIRAEAANLGWTTESLSSLYVQGITLSHEQWGVSAPSATYLANANVAVGAVGAVNNVRNISTQRYLASYPDGQQGWNIWRKTGFPTLVPASAAVNSSKQIPRRLAYSATEQTTNKANNDAAIARLTGGNTQDARMWWDQ
ncbi:SusD/RagB family nutrient-binding outer membrane lipoprotein [Pedobacter sp. Leaf250]|uniref:SusD/RagB family nutrient-binding outer membrane lipoprotein n=1 Tax=Pedobacter sp. Leaf250 TaxID=2876559 RepID=UPI001E4294F0|nr:SusD/RagB family nutrient-binding outer membrane lipoprotein [Pedobacter sp. Leaf250]